MIKNLLIAGLFTLIAHIFTWYQLQGQFIWDSFKKNPLLVSLLGIPISYFFIMGVKWGVKAFDGQLWPTRFLGFGVGVLVYSVLVSTYFNEGITTKTAISIGLALIIICVQVFWK